VSFSHVCVSNFYDSLFIAMKESLLIFFNKGFHHENIVYGFLLPIFLKKLETCLQILQKKNTVVVYRIILFFYLDLISSYYFYYNDCISFISMFSILLDSHFYYNLWVVNSNLYQLFLRILFENEFLTSW
jgi:hypothetical protein